MLLETAELAAYISGTLAAFVYVLDTCYPFCIKKCFPVKINENGNPITNKNKERDKTNSKGKKTLLRSKIKDMMKEDSERIGNQMKNKKKRQMSSKNLNQNLPGRNTLNYKDSNKTPYENIYEDLDNTFSIQAFELQLCGVGKEKGVSKRVSRYNNIQHSRKRNRHRRHSSMFTRNKYRKERDSLKNSHSSSSLNNFRNRNIFSPIRKSNSYDKYFGESDDSKHELTSLFEDNDLIDLNNLSTNLSNGKMEKPNDILQLPKIVIQPSSYNSNSNSNNSNNRNNRNNSNNNNSNSNINSNNSNRNNYNYNNDLLLPDNKDVLYRNINDIKSDNSIYNTLLESNKEESLKLKKNKTLKSCSYSSIYSTDTDDGDYLDVFQTSKSL